MATQTPNYHFPKYEADDLPNLLDEYNEFADLADAAINNAMMTATNAGTAAQTAKTAADAASAKADDVEETVKTVSAQVVTAQNTAEQALSLAQTNESDIAGLDAQVETANQSITALQSGKAPTNHASSSGTYGTGTATNYGHVRLSDSPGATGAASSVAATPAAVQSVINQAGAIKITSGSFPTSGGNISSIGGNNTVEVIAVPLIHLIVVSVHLSDISISGGGSAGLTIPGFIPEAYRPTNDIRVSGNSVSLPNTHYSADIVVKPNGDLELSESCSATAVGMSCNTNMMYLYGLDLESLEA